MHFYSQNPTKIWLVLQLNGWIKLSDFSRWSVISPIEYAVKFKRIRVILKQSMAQDSVTGCQSYRPPSLNNELHQSFGPTA